MDNKFTESEIREFFQLLREVSSLPSLHTEIANYKSIAETLKQMMGQGAELHDEFGLNKINISLKSILLANEEIGLQGDVIVAFMLQSLYDGIGTIPNAKSSFPAELLRAADTLQKLSRIDTKIETMQSDDFKNLFVSQAEDIRIVLMLICSNVVLMRNIKDTPNVEAQRRVSVEAAYVYAPLAHKLGLYKLKSELEDLSLKYLEHDAYYMIKEDLNATKKSRDEYIERFISPIRKMLDSEGIRYHIKGRTKSIHSIWQKMKKQKCGFNGVYDLFAIRIIVNVPVEKEKEQCWKVFSLITNKYESNLKRLRDWLTVPKSNGYESLHITVLGPEDKWVEVQIRSERMDEIAEHGLAAHWRYKGVKSSGGVVDSWLADVRSALETGNEKLLSETLSEKETRPEVYVFSPKGDLYRLPGGATVLDFAYHIHSNIGNKCVGAKINGKNVSMRQVLESGETVEITTSNTQTPKMEWANFVVSSHARAKIRAAVRDLQAREGVLAKELFERKLKNRKIDWDESIINQLIKKSGYKESSEFYKAISNGDMDINALIDTYVELGKRESGQLERAAARSAKDFTLEKEKDRKEKAPTEDVLIIDRNLKGIDFQMAKCCNPVYGDDVFGFITVGGGIKIHRTNCPNAPALRQRFGYRIVPAKWAGKGGGKYAITLRIVGHDDLGIVNNITSIISKEEHILLRSINIDSNDGLFAGILTVMVDDKQVLNTLIKKIQTVKGVKAVSRA